MVGADWARGSLHADVITSDPANNVTEHIFEKIGYNLHKRPEHPLGIIKAVIGEYFDDKFGKDTFSQFDDEYPVVGPGRYCSPRAWQILLATS